MHTLPDFPLHQDASNEYPIVVSKHTELQTIYRTYADFSGKSIRSIRLNYKGDYIFLSRSGKVTVGDFDMKLNDVVLAVEPSRNIVPAEAHANTLSTALKVSNINTNTFKHRQVQQRSQWSGFVDNRDEQYYRIQHSERLTHVLKEAEPHFEVIRKLLNDLNIKRTQPKNKSKVMETLPTEQNDNDKAYSWGEVKVGRGHYYVNVGEVENLYKTSKHRKLSPTSKQIPLDLHGHTKEQAVAALNENLPSWIETAMKGEYPFLVQVEIVCGKGNQILAEVVEGWIKHEKHVANAPRMRNWLQWKRYLFIGLLELICTQ